MWKSIIIPLAVVTLLFSCKTPPAGKMAGEMPTGEIPTTGEPKQEREMKKGAEQPGEKPAPQPETSLPEVSIEKEKPQGMKGKFPVKREIPRITNVMIESYLKRMSIRQKIGQLFITWVKGRFVNGDIERLIKEGYIGGVILNRHNIESRDQLSAFISRMQQLARSNDPPIELFVGVDQEGGRVERIKFPEFTRFPAAHYWGEYGDPYFVEAVGYITGKELSSIGCNMNFAPVLDLYGRADDSIIGDRSMGDNIENVSRFGVFYIFGATEAGIIPVIKHFPGHGVSRIDSHKKLPVVDISEETLFSRDIIPFKTAIQYGAEALMTAHILYRKIDPDNPVTMSKKILKGILREKLGFKGVVISDAIDMGALTGNNSIDDILKKTILAGVDIILVNSKYDVLDLEKRVLAMYREGKISLDLIDESVRRIIALKLRHSLIK